MRAILFLVSLLGTISIKAQVPIVGSQSQINNAIFLNNMKEGLEYLNRGAQIRSTFLAELHSARNNYWNEINNNKISSSSYEQYYKLLKEKDYYFLYLEYMTRMDNSRNKGTLEFGGIIDMLMGGWVTGTFDGGILPFAQYEFNRFCSAALSVFLNKNSTESDIKYVNKVYSEYCVRRDLGEYLFKNYHSPLTSNQLNEKYLEAWLTASCISNTISDSKEFISKIVGVYGNNAIKIMCDAANNLYNGVRLRQNHNEWNIGRRSPSESFWFTPVNRTSFFWNLSKLDSTMIVPYHIMRHNYLDYATAKTFADFRKKRHGIDNFNKVVSRLKKELDNDYFYDATKPLGGKPPTIGSLRVKDGSAELLSNHLEIWKDVQELGIGQRNKKNYRKILVEKLQFLQDTLQKQNLRSVENRLSDIFMTLDEDLLLTAVAANDALGNKDIGYGSIDRLSMSREFGKLNSLSYKLGLNNILKIYFGLSQIAENPQTFSVLSLSDSYLYMDFLERCEHAIKDYKQLISSYGDDKVKQIASSIRHEFAPNHFYTSFTRPFKLFFSLVAEDFPNLLLESELIKSNAKTVEEIRDKYRKKLQKYHDQTSQAKSSYDLRRLKLWVSVERAEIIYTDEEITLIYGNYIVFNDKASSKLPTILEAQIATEEFLYPVVKYHVEAKNSNNSNRNDLAYSNQVVYNLSQLSFKILTENQLSHINMRRGYQGTDSDGFYCIHGSYLNQCAHFPHLGEYTYNKDRETGKYIFTYKPRMDSRILFTSFKQLEGLF